jgi:hypothetical protein
MQTLEAIELLDTELPRKRFCGGCSTTMRCACIRVVALHFERSCEAERVAVLKSYPASELKELPDPDGDPDALRILRNGLRVPASDAQRITIRRFWATREECRHAPSVPAPRTRPPYACAGARKSPQGFRP